MCKEIIVFELPAVRYSERDISSISGIIILYHNYCK